MKRSALALALLVAWAATPALAQDAPPKPEEKTAEEKAKEIQRTEVIVVSASKTEVELINAPATMSVITADTIATSAAQNYGDLLRSTPGLNIIQTSARDINMTSRQSTSTLANSQLVMVDGRSIYLDFFGLVLWDFVPQNLSEIKQIEVVRGPASAVWGANDLNMQGGLFNRSKGSREAEGSGYLYGANFSYAKAPSEKLAWRLSAGYFNSDPFSRPVGTIPLDCHPLGVVPCRDGAGKAVAGGYPVGGAPYPADQSGRGSFANDGTSQPKVDLRLDQELGTGGSNGRITYQGGYSGTTGIIHTGVGPFQIQSGSYLGYGKVQWTKNAMKLGAFGNFADVKAPNLLGLNDPTTGDPVALNFTTQTYDIEFGNSNVLGGKNILSYGGNYRRNNFNITLTPQAQDRNELGAYFQEEYFTDRFRISVGARVDKFGNLDKAVFSPRVSLMYKPGVRHSIRASYNRAFRSPSVVNNYLDLPISAPPPPINLAPLGAAVPSLKPLIPEPFFLTVLNRGSEVVTPPYSLKQESIDAYELAYTGSVGKTTIGIAIYLNKQDDNINFTGLTPSPDFPQGLPGLTYYSPTNPATGVGAVTGKPVILSPLLMGILAKLPPQVGGPILFPETVFSYLNLGPIQNKGIELSIDQSFSNDLTGFANYSYQATPKVLDPASGQIRYPISEVGIPAQNRFNAGLNWNASRYLGSVSVNYADKAFWNDVLSAPYYGYTDSYTLVNASFGMKWNDGKVITSLKGTNLANQTIQQHVFGDIMKIGAAFEVKIFTK